MSVGIENMPVKDPEALSCFLSHHKHNDTNKQSLLFCRLTKKDIRNRKGDAVKHIEGSLFRHKFYEMFRKKLGFQTTKFLRQFTRVNREVETGKRKSRPLVGVHSEENICKKGFLKTRKLFQLQR